jgi:hypothetical protein
MMNDNETSIIVLDGTEITSLNMLQ